MEASFPTDEKRIPSAAMRTRWRRNPQVWQWAIVVCLVVLLEFISRAGLVRRATLVPPTEMLQTLVSLTLSGQIIPHFSRTMVEIFASFAIAATLGVAVGILFWRFTYLGKVFEPYIVSLYALPIVMFYPILLVFLGLGSLPVIFIAVISIIIPIILNTTVGFAEIRDVLYKVARSNNCTRWQTFTKVQFPAAAPYVFTGLKLGFVYAVTVTIAMEFILADSGLGFQVHEYYDFFNTPAMYAYILINVLISVLANALLFGGEGRIRKEGT